jgi:hypothetical protein
MTSTFPPSYTALAGAPSVLTRAGAGPVDWARQGSLYFWTRCVRCFSFWVAGAATHTLALGHYRRHATGVS